MSIAFLKKEAMELVRTSKAIILPALFLFFGILSPLTAKYMNTILSMAGGQQGLEIKFPDPTLVQSYQQFFKNLYFMMIVVTILVFAGTVSEEKSRGTAALVLTKCLSRVGFISSKLIASIMLFTVSYALSAAVCIYYTYLLFGSFSYPGIFTSLLLYWIFGLVMLSFALLASTLSKSITVSVVCCFVGYAAVSALAAIPRIGMYTPGTLQALSVEIAMGAKSPADALIPVCVSMLLALAAVLWSVHVFKKQEL